MFWVFSRVFAILQSCNLAILQSWVRGRLGVDGHGMQGGAILQSCNLGFGAASGWTVRGWEGGTPQSRNLEILQSEAKTVDKTMNRQAKYIDKAARREDKTIDQTMKTSSKNISKTMKSQAKYIDTTMNSQAKTIDKTMKNGAKTIAKPMKNKTNIEHTLTQ